MTQTKSITEIPTGRQDVFAFRIAGEVEAAEMEAMAQRMNDAFDRFDSVNMLIIFDLYEGSETGASLNIEAMKAQFRAVSKVGRYAVVGAPEAASRIIDLFDRVSPVDARTFDSDEEHAAWRFVGAEATVS